MGHSQQKRVLGGKFSKLAFLAQNSSLGLVDDAQSEIIGEKQEYMP